MRARGLIAAALVATACGHGGRPRVEHCREAGAHVAEAMKVVRPELAAAEVDPAPEVAALCAADGWSTKIVECYRVAATPRQARACSEQLTDEQREHARAMQEALYKRASQVGEEDPGELPAICGVYVELVDDLDSCPAMAEAERDQLREMAEQSRMQWRVLLATDDDGARDQVEQGCQIAAQVLRDLRAARGC
ncbi:MAG: hypothetical protein IPH44_35570 [Myxococcales bacterium]|nr:hypothetical protein [Myxococcales bacterium]MBK7194760.1 hypothetical protein [Myxococcales bacterium]MBP6843692.1 hypothetical protein [Kofleriaceae bacterium]